MASSDNLDCVDPWLFRPAELWFSDPFSYEADALITKALTSSVSSADNSLSELLGVVPNTSDVTNPSPSPNPDTPRGEQSITISGSGSGFGSDQETVSKRKRSAQGPVSGRVGKRKSRASKKSPTTFITADAANFRQMVQQVTGVKFPSSGQFSSMAPVLKPEPQRIGASVHACLPTLDTSAFLLDHHHQQVMGHSSAMASQSGAAMAFAPPPVGDIGGDAGANGGRRSLDFDSFSCFPTLESWGVM